MSVFVVSPKAQKRAFLKSYEKVCEMVAPKTARALTPDADFVYRVIVFRKLLDDFKNGCREHHFTTSKFTRVAVDDSHRVSLEDAIEGQKKTLPPSPRRTSSTPYTLGST